MPENEFLFFSWHSSLTKLNCKNFKKFFGLVWFDCHIQSGKLYCEYSLHSMKSLEYEFCEFSLARWLNSMLYLPRWHFFLLLTEMNEI